MHQVMHLGDVVDVGRRTHHRVHQSAVSVHANMGFHSKMPLVTLLGLMHLGVACAGAVLGRAGRSNQRGVDGRAFLEQQPLGRQRRVDGLQHLGRQVMAFEQMAKPHDAHPVGQPVHPAQPGQLPVQRDVEQRLFHRHVRQPEPLLKEVNAQHHLNAEGRAPFVLARRMRRNQHQQCALRNHAFQLIQELRLTGLAARQLQAKISLFHAVIVSTA